jgi:hypothetical protein
VLRGAREGAQLDRLDPVVACGITQLIGLDGSPAAVGRRRRPPERVGALVALVGLTVERLDQEICELPVKAGAPGAHGRLLAGPVH